MYKMFHWPYSNLLAIPNLRALMDYTVCDWAGCALSAAHADL